MMARTCEIFICDRCGTDWMIAVHLPMLDACDCGGALIPAFPEHPSCQACQMARQVGAAACPTHSVRE